MIKPNIKIVGFRVLIELDNISAAGLVVPDVAQTRDASEGTVVALGDGRLSQSDKVIPFPCAIGDRVWVSPHGGGAPRRFTVDGQEFVCVLVSADDIFAVLPDPSRIVTA